jgi:hypothetical protein
LTEIQILEKVSPNELGLAVGFEITAFATVGYAGAAGVLRNLETRSFDIRATPKLLRHQIHVFSKF